MLGARMHGYRQPLVLEEVNVPEISSEKDATAAGEAAAKEALRRHQSRKSETIFKEAIAVRSGGRHQLTDHYQLTK